MWKTLKKKIKFVEPKKNYKQVFPNEKDTSTYEEQYSFKFPNSYKSFLTEIGPGLLNGYFTIFGPLLGTKRQNLFTETQGVRNSKVLVEIYKDKKKIQNLVPFCFTVGGDIVGWDGTENKRVEPKLLCLPRHKEEILRLDQNFRSFIKECCYGLKLFEIIDGYSDPDWVIDYEFSPFTRRS